MKVLVVTTYFPQTSETFILDHVVGLINKKINVKVISMFEAPKQVIHQQFETYHLATLTHNERPSQISKTYSIWLQLMDAFWACFRYPRAFTKLLVMSGLKQKRTYFAAFKNVALYREADVIHAHFGHVGNRLTFLKRIGIIPRHTPIICSFHGSDIDEPYYRQRPNFYHTFFKDVNLVISNSAYLTSRLVASGCNPDKIKMVKNGVDVNYFTVAEKKVNEQKTHFNVLTVARLTEVKGIKYGIEAVKMLVMQGINHLHYHIIGQGEQMQALKKQIADYELSKNVHLWGALDRERVKSSYANAAVFLLPGVVTTGGRVETQGVVIQEAQAMSLPVIATNVGGIPEGVIDGETGFIVPSQEATAIASKIKTLIDNENLRLTMAKAARNYAVAYADQRHQLNAIENIYKEALVGK